MVQQRGRSIAPSLWYFEFPPDITSQVVLDKNPQGTLTNSDLEITGVMLQFVALEQLGKNNLCHVSVTIGCDNSPAVAWTQHMATHASSPVAYCLLWGLSYGNESPEQPLWSSSMLPGPPILSRTLYHVPFLCCLTPINLSPILTHVSPSSVSLVAAPTCAPT